MTLDAQNKCSAATEHHAHFESIAEGIRLSRLIDSEETICPPRSRVALEPETLACGRFVAAKGLRLKDACGIDYLDACSGTFNVSLGYGNKAVVEPVQRILSSGLTHVSSSFEELHVKNARNQLLGISSNNLKCCDLKGATGGSVANLTAIRSCLRLGSSTVVGVFNGSHHGAILTQTKDERNSVREHQKITFDAPDCFRCKYGKRPATCSVECIGPIEEQLRQRSDRRMAAFIAEPILGAGGGITPPIKYWVRLATVLRTHNVPLIFDEVQTFGRTGNFFAAQHFGVEPNLITLGKGISGVGIPSAGAVLSEARFDVLESVEHSYTWGGSVITSAAIDATINVMSSPGFFGHTIEVASVLRCRLEALCAKYDGVCKLRGTGLMTGIEFIKSDTCRAPNAVLADRVLKAAFDRRLILRRSFKLGSAFLKIRPSLTITSDEAIEICDILDSSIEACVGSRRELLS